MSRQLVIPLVLLVSSFCTICYIGNGLSKCRNSQTQRELLQVNSQIISQTAQASLHSGLTKQVNSHIVVDFNSNAIHDKNSNIKIAVGQYPADEKPYKLTIETPHRSEQYWLSKSASPSNYFTNEDYEIFPKSPLCNPSEKEKNRKLARKGDGFSFSPSKLLLMELPECDWNQYRGVSKNMFTPDRMQFETVTNVFRHSGIHIYSTTEVTHQTSYPLPNLDRDIIHNLTSREDICKVLDSSKWLFCCKKYWSKREIDGEMSYDFLPVGSQQPCAERIFAAGFPCAMVDWNSVHQDVPGTIFIPPTQQQEKGRQFLLQPWTKPVGTNKNSNVKFYDRIAPVLEVYGDRSGHFVPEILPWIVYLVLTLPPDVPILMIRTGHTEKFLPILVEAKLTSMERFVQFRSGTVYAAREVIKVQYWPNCASDANFLPSQEMAGLVRQIYAPEIPYDQRNGITIIHRADSSSRVVTNNDQLVERIQRDIPGITVTTFVANNFSMIDAINLFRNSKIVIGAHGAGMEINLMWCGQGTHIIEIGFDATHPPLPSGVYALAVALNLDYWLTLGKGSLFGKDLTPNIDEIMRILHKIMDK